MKTEPMEALKFLYSVEDPTDNIPMHLTPKDKADHVCRLAFKEGQSNPIIKQLEWVEYENFHGRKSYLSKTPFSSYDVADGGDHFTMFSPNKRLRFASADEAKAAAQKDFEERVEKCIAK